ncbi:hypothetical protein BI313_05865 [Xanthomonas vesicatoria]|nr:hypothetical protein BI313_05865 [Xanthomonas vesicatoria]
MPNIWQTPISSTPDSKPGRYSGRGDVVTDLGKSQPKQDAWIGGHRFLWHERTMQLQPLSGHAL